MNERAAAFDLRHPPAGVTTVALDDPNGALTPELLAQLGDVLARVREDPEMRMLVLVGDGGPVFCSGMDVEAVGADPAGLVDQAGLMYDLLLGLRESRLLTVCAVDGWVSGGGLGLLAVSDLVLCTPRSQFSLPEVLWGLVPWTVLPFVQGRISEATARRMASTGLPLGAAAARAAGLVDEVTPDVTAAVSAVSRRMARISPQTLADNKRYLSELWGPRLSRDEVLAAVGGRADETASRMLTSPRTLC